jgi:predicted transcriptional regulator
MRPTEIFARARKIKLANDELARRAGLNSTTVDRALLGKTDPRISTLNAIAGALVAAEVEMRDYLNALHPGEERAA